MTHHTTTSQTVGPFFSLGMEPTTPSELADRDVPGERITIRGRVLDGDGQPVPDAILEFWQANAVGKYAHPEDEQPNSVERAFIGFARVPTNIDGAFELATIKPGPVPGTEDHPQAPHIAVSVFARGLLRRLVTRVYFPGEILNEKDFALHLVPSERRATLIARRSESTARILHWDVILQGVNETVFFDC